MQEEMIKIIETLEGQPTIYRAVMFLDSNGLLSRKGRMIAAVMKYAHNQDHQKKQ